MCKCVRCKQPMEAYMRGYKVIHATCFDCEMDKIYEIPKFTSTLIDVKNMPINKHNSVKPKIRN